MQAINEILSELDALIEESQNWLENQIALAVSVQNSKGPKTEIDKIMRKADLYSQRVISLNDAKKIVLSKIKTTTDEKHT